MIRDLERFLAHPGVIDSKPYDATHHDAARRLAGYDWPMSNECPLPPSPRVLDAPGGARGHQLYPHSGEEVRRATAEFRGALPESVVLGNGSTEVLDVVTWPFVGDGDETVLAVPTYNFFETQTRLSGGTPALVPLRDDWSLDVDGRWPPSPPDQGRVPVQPQQPHRQRLVGGRAGGGPCRRRAHRGRPGSPGVRARRVVRPLVARHPNLVVTRTFSKAFPLAALRIGYGVMHPDLADAALRLRIPFSLGLPALRAAAAALADPADIEARRDFISGERERVFTATPSWTGSTRTCRRATSSR